MLSEFAGAAQSLGAGAILVNPWNITDMAAAIEDALTMSDQVRQHRPLVMCSQHEECQPILHLAMTISSRAVKPSHEEEPRVLKALHA